MSNVSVSNVLGIALQKQQLNPSLSPDGELGCGPWRTSRRLTPPPSFQAPTRPRRRDPRGGHRAPFQTRVALTGAIFKNPCVVFRLIRLDCTQKSQISPFRVGGWG